MVGRAHRASLLSSREAVLQMTCVLSWSPALQAAIAAALGEWEEAGCPPHVLGETNRRERWYREAGRRVRPDPVVAAVARLASAVPSVSGR